MKNKLIAIIGPTGSKKSYVAMELAKFLNYQAEIISVDSFQVYKEISVGINKPSKKSLELVKHYFVDHISINDEWNIKIFQNQCNDIIDSIFKKNMLPILCGGSHLYLDVVTQNYNLDNTPQRNRNLYKNLANDELYQKLLIIDPYEAIKITKNNRKRLERALEIYEVTGKTKALANLNNPIKYEVLYVFCNLNNRNDLMDILNKRTLMMYQNNWVEEVNYLIKKYPNFVHSQAAKAIGYSYIINCILNNVSVDVSNLQKIVRQLAKRQITWCKNHYNENKIHFDVFHDDINALCQKISNFLKS